MTVLSSEDIRLYWFRTLLTKGRALIEFTRISLGTGGLPRCGLCAPADLSVMPRGIEEVQSDVDAAIAGWSWVPGPNLVFGGMEAFSHPNLPALVVSAASAGVQRIALETGGGPLGRGENAGGALYAGVRHLVVHSVPGDEVDALAGTRAFLEAAREANLPVVVSACIRACSHTARDVTAAVFAAVETGAGAVRLEWTSAIKPGSTAMAHILAACDTGVVNGVWVEVAGIAMPASHHGHASSGAVA